MLPVHFYVNLKSVNTSIILVQLFNTNYSFAQNIMYEHASESMNCVITHKQKNNVQYTEHVLAHTSTLIFLMFQTSNLIIVSKETASRLLLRNSHYHTFNSECRTFNDYQTFNTTCIQVLYSCRFKRGRIK